MALKLDLSAGTQAITATVSGLNPKHGRSRYFYWTVNGYEVGYTTDAGDNETHETTFTSATPNTEYTISVKICDTPAFGSTLFGTLQDTVKTDHLLVIAECELWNYETSIVALVRYLFKNQGFYIIAEDDDGNEYSTTPVYVSKDGESASATLTGLTPGKTYTVRVIICDLYNYSEEIAEEELTTDDICVDFSVEPDKTSLAFTVQQLPVEECRVTLFVVEMETNTEIYGSKNAIYHEDNLETPTVLGGLKPKTWYRVNIQIKIINGGYVAEGTAKEVQTLSNRPDPWGWTNVLERGVACVKLTAKDWNNFTAHINVMRKYAGLAEKKDFTTAIQKETEISEGICNEAWDAIYEIDTSTGRGLMPDRAKKDRPLEAKFFNDLRDALNAIE